ncbi:early nodulin-like protein 1 [Phtheirospermum japonicum]|uniref:Early nodulin-like protein 1 n=1 Tax=Phtheirospermum japonicum TaxID=374723 RepID=A0A830B205_9LAMI|nr:early nodulin-like protein 1 [Phtheirospermum japonicum]
MVVFSTAQISSLLLLTIFLLAGFSKAQNHVIKAWQIPSSVSDSLNHWAKKFRFLIGDSLVFKYDGSKDSVLEVTRRDYVTCNTSAPIKNYIGGDTTVRLGRPGLYYFISGAEGHCQKGQKLISVVISERHRRVISPAPSPSAGNEGPAVAPAPASGAGSLSGGLLVLGLGALLVVM